MNPTEKSSGQPVLTNEEWSPIYQAEAWYAEQGLNDQDIVNMDLTLHLPQSLMSVFGFNVGAPSILIPYPNEPFPRVRRLGVSENKYMSPRGSGCTQPYLPQGFGIPWSEIKTDTRLPSVIVEGEVKSYWGCKTGQLTIGIGGVDMQATLFDGSWDWKDRVIYVCFDHDAGQEPGQYKREVNNALGRLCSSLLEHGADVAVLHLGKVVSDPSRKYGLDDYLREVGVVGWDSLLKTATPPPEWSKDLANMLEDNIYVVGTNHVHVYSLTHKYHKTPSDFHDTHVEKKKVVTDDNGKNRVLFTSRTWLDHPHRMTADNYVLNPRLPFGLQGRHINLWHGYPHFEAGTADKTFAVQDEWQKFMEGLFGEQWMWVGLWTGHLLNCPWEKTSQAVMLKTIVQGIGKSLFGDIVRDLTGPHGVESSVSRMFNSFNAEMQAKTFAMVNELDVSFNSKEGQLNDLLTEDTVKVEQKGKDVIEHENLRRWYFTTNSSHPARLTKGQRRVLVIEPPLTIHDGTGEWGQWVNRVVAKFRRDGEALAAIRGWFDALWLAEGEGKWDPTARVPVTQASLDAAEASMTDGQVISEGLLQFIEASPQGWVAVHPDFKKVDSKVFGDLKALVTAHGGTVSRKNVKEGGVTTPKEFTVYSLGQELERSKKNASNNYSAKVSSEEARKSDESVRIEYQRLRKILTAKRGFG